MAMSSLQHTSPPDTPIAYEVFPIELGGFLGRNLKIPDNCFGIIAMHKEGMYSTHEVLTPGIKTLPLSATLPFLGRLRSEVGIVKKYFNVILSINGIPTATNNRTISLTVRLHIEFKPGSVENFYSTWLQWRSRVQFPEEEIEGVGKTSILTISQLGMILSYHLCQSQCLSIVDYTKNHEASQLTDRGDPTHQEVLESRLYDELENLGFDWLNNIGIRSLDISLESSYGSVPGSLNPGRIDLIKPKKSDRKEEKELSVLSLLSDSLQVVQLLLGVAGLVFGLFRNEPIASWLGANSTLILFIIPVWILLLLITRPAIRKIFGVDSKTNTGAPISSWFRPFPGSVDPTRVLEGWLAPVVIALIIWGMYRWLAPDWCYPVDFGLFWGVLFLGFYLLVPYEWLHDRNLRLILGAVFFLGLAWHSDAHAQYAGLLGAMALAWVVVKVSQPEKEIAWLVALFSPALGALGVYFAIPVLIGFLAEKLPERALLGAVAGLLTFLSMTVFQTPMMVVVQSIPFFLFQAVFWGLITYSASLLAAYRHWLVDLLTVVIGIVAGWYAIQIGKMWIHPPIHILTREWPQELMFSAALALLLIILPRTFSNPNKGDVYGED